MSGAPDRPAPAFLPLIVENLPLDDLAPYRQFVTRSSGSRHGGDARGATQQGVTSLTAQDVAKTQRLADAAASTSTAAWMLTGRYACYLLAEALPTP
jgi:hypothetical protein